MKSIKEAMLRKSIAETVESAFFKEYVTLPDDLLSQTAQIHSMKEGKLDALFRDVLKTQKEFVSSIESPLNELLNVSQGELALTLSQQVTWQGLHNDTELPIEMTLDKDTELNWLEFIIHPLTGMVFQLCLGQGPSGYHFNVSAKDVLLACDDLREFLNDAVKLAAQDEELDLAVYGEINKDVAEISDGSWS